MSDRNIISEGRIAGQMAEMKFLTHAGGKRNREEKRAFRCNKKDIHHDGNGCLLVYGLSNSVYSF